MTPSDGDIGLALSGGGHRATLFGLGALLYIADSGFHKHVTTIASVSSGSITNACVALTKPAFNHSDAPRYFERTAAALAQRISGSPKWWNISRLLSALLIARFVWVLWTFPLDAEWWRHLSLPLIGMAAVAVFVGPRSGGSLWGWPHPWLWIAALCASLVPTAAVWKDATHWGHYAVGGVLIILGSGMVLFARGHALRWALGRTIREAAIRGGTVVASGSPAGPLTGMNHEIDHVICATEMHSGAHAYFGRDFIYTRAFGFGIPADLDVSVAVHASASFPFVFPLCFLRTARHAFRCADPDGGRGTSRTPPFMALSDGGIFDNMADAWQLESPERERRLRNLNRRLQDSRVAEFVEKLHARPSALLVIDAAPPPSFASMRGAGFPMWTELIGTLKAALITYTNATMTRSRDLAARFAAGNPHGVIIASAKSPLSVVEEALSPDDGQQPSDAIRARALEAREYLTAFGRDFSDFPRLSMESGTYLTTVGQQRASHLLFHGYLQAMITLHVHFGWPLMAPSGNVSEFLNDFRLLADGHTRAARPVARSGVLAGSPR